MLIKYTCIKYTLRLQGEPDLFYDRLQKSSFCCKCQKQQKVQATRNNDLPKRISYCPINSIQCRHNNNRNGNTNNFFFSPSSLILTNYVRYCSRRRAYRCTSAALKTCLRDTTGTKLRVVPGPTTRRTTSHPQLWIVLGERKNP